MKSDHHSFYYPLFKHMADNHGLTLTDSEMEDICQIAERLVKDRRERIKNGQQPELRQEEIEINDELTDAAPKTPESAATQSRHSVQ